MQTLRRLAQTPALKSAAVLVGLVGSLIISASSVAYFDDDELPDFVIEKLPLPLEDVWLLALQLHVAAAAIALPGCLLLVAPRLLRLAPVLHRWLGRVVGLVVLLVLAPSGFYLSLFAKGGLPATVGFMLSGVVVVAAMVHGVRTARVRNFVAHRRAMAHVVAQLSVALTSRAMLFALDATDADPDLAYLVSLWLPVVGSALVVEVLLPRVPSLTVSAPIMPWRSPMKRVSSLVSSLVLCALFLLPTMASATPPEAPSTPSAPPSETTLTATRVLQQKLLTPLAAKDDERSKFSRARMAPQERRVRILDAAARVDDKGQAFVTFAVDSRHGYAEVAEQSWRTDAITGCVYPGSGAVFVNKGDVVRPAAMLLGKKTSDAPAHTCRAAADVVDHS